MSTQGQPQVSESVVRKIQLLFELANRAQGNEVEAAAAMAKAQDLLTKYNLDLAMVQSQRVEGGRPQEEKREQVQSQRTAMYKWQVDLCKAVCEANFCWHWIVERMEEYQISGRSVRKHKRPRRVKRHVMLGRESNTKVAGMMYEYLVDTIERLLPYPNNERLSSSANSWRQGCVDRLIERIKDKVATMKKAQTNDAEHQSTALAIRNLHTAEHIANYDARYGDGAWARRQALEARWADEAKANEEAHEARLAAMSPEERKAYDLKQAEEDRKAEAYWERVWARERKQEQREFFRRDHKAYHEGRHKGESIGLDTQVSAGKPKKELM